MFDLAEFILACIHDDAAESIRDPWSRKVGVADGFEHHKPNYESTRLENTLYFRDVRDGTCWKVTAEKIDKWPDSI